MAVVECSPPVFALHALWPQDHEQLGRMLEGMVDSEVGTTDSTELNLQVQSVPPHGGGHTHTSTFNVAAAAPHNPGFQTVILLGSPGMRCCFVLLQSTPERAFCAHCELFLASMVPSYEAQKLFLARLASPFSTGFVRSRCL